MQTDCLSGAESALLVSHSHKQAQLDLPGSSSQKWQWDHRWMFIFWSIIAVKIFCLFVFDYMTGYWQIRAFLFISLFICSGSFSQILQVSIIYFGFVSLVSHLRHAEAALLPPKPALLRWMCVITLVPRTIPVVPFTCSDRWVYSSGIVSCSRSSPDTQTPFRCALAFSFHLGQCCCWIGSPALLKLDSLSAGPPSCIYDQANHLSQMNVCDIWNLIFFMIKWKMKRFFFLTDIFSCLQK